MDDLKRQFTRVGSSWAAHFRFDRTAPFQPATGTNLSLGGVFVESPSAPRIGAAVQVRFLPKDGDQPIDADGRVVHSDDRGFGVEFTKTDDRFVVFVQMRVEHELLRNRR